MTHREWGFKIIFKDREGNIGNKKIRKYNGYIENNQIKILNKNIIIVEIIDI